MTVSLAIEVLVLDGFSSTPRQALAVQSALRGQLAALLASGELPAVALRSRARVTAPGAIGLSPKSDPTLLGKQIGHAVYAGVTR